MGSQALEDKAIRCATDLLIPQMATRRTSEHPSRAKPRTARRPKPRAAEITSLKAANARLRAYQRRIATLEAHLARLEETRAAERAAARRRMTGIRRHFEARLTRMVQEIGGLRHHEVRARALERALATKERELRRLSELLHR